MADTFTLKVIARIKSDFTQKFGIPRQSSLGGGQLSTVVFEPEYRDANALRGIEGYSHLWLIWGFSMVERQGWRPTVKPPRLGGNTRMGVFATRSPYRPNPIGLSSVKLVSMENRPGLGHVLTVEGADLMDGTPIYDIFHLPTATRRQRTALPEKNLKRTFMWPFQRSCLLPFPLTSGRRCFPPFPRTRGPHTSRTGSSTALSFPALTCASA